jgi:GntR family transcriptional repressor for pyruvate dehydrogenase complex
MNVQAVNTRTFGDQIFSQLAAEILTGRYLPGENLPSERTLAEALEVNRQVVREALKRLAQVGLTSIQQGGGNRVLDFRRSAGLDLMALMAEHAHVTADVGNYWQSVLEMRVAVAADVVRLFVLRSKPEQKTRLAAIGEAARASNSEVERTELDRSYWELLEEGAQNIAYRLAFNTMRRSVLALGERTVRWVNFELKLTDCRRALTAAVLAGDADAAEQECRRSLREALAIYEQKAAERAAAAATSTPAPADGAAEPITRTSLRALERPARLPRKRSEPSTP